MKFTELVNIDDLKRLCENFTSMTGMVTAILDLDGNILISTGWEDLCTYFHRVHPITAERCRESDTVLAGKLKEGEQVNIYKCKNGLVDVAIPVKTHGTHVANLFTGQFFFEPPDRNFFIRQAEEFGFDKEDYLEALDRVPVYSQDAVESAISFLSQIGQLLGEMGLVRKNLEDANRELEQESTHRSESEQRYQTLFERVGVSLWDEDYSEILTMIEELKQQGITDVATYIRERPEFVAEATRRLKILDVNNATLKLFHMKDKEELLGSLDKVFIPESFPVFREALVAIAEGRESFESESINGTLNGDKIDVLMTANFPKEFKKQGRLTVCLVDITDRKKAERERLDLEIQLRQKYKMDSVGVMAGGMAHNFNNNLSIILGNVELSKMKMAPNPEIDGYLSNAKIAVLRSRDLIQQILTYSRQGDKDKTSIQLPLVIDETLQLLRSTIPTTMNLQKQISSDSHDLAINSDSSQIQECLINLCNNAMYAMEEEGDITIALDSVELQKQDIPIQYKSRPGQYAKLSVQDTGSGMSAETVDNAFDLFFTTKPVDQGTGVGLSTVQGIVTQHGGLIKVNSHLGEGTTFELYFPVTEQIQVTETISVSEDLPKGTEHILFIDDDEMLAKLGEMILKEMGYQVTMMTDSIKALKLFTANPTHFDMVITDQTMPDLTGKELIHKLKKVRADIPTIICTGFSSKVDEDSAKELGASAFLMKPLDMPKLLQTVRRVLDGK